MIERLGNRLISFTPPWFRNALRRIKYYSMGNVPQRLYWNMAASISPTASICTDCFDERLFYESGRGQVDLMRKLGVLGPSVRAIDIGCGMGRIESAIQAEVESVVGVDVSTRMVEFAREKVQSSNVCFQAVNGRRLDGIDSACFDLCFSFMVFQHMPRSAVASYFADVARVLRPGGWFVFQIPVATQEKQPEPPLDHPFAMRYYSPRAIKGLLEQAGLQLVSRFDWEGNKAPLTAEGMPGHACFLASK